MRILAVIALSLLAGIAGPTVVSAATAAAQEITKLPLKTVQRQAKTGDIASQVELARRFGTGDGGAKKDEAKAAQLLRPAVEKGDPTAQYYLGLAYLTGTGVQQDESQAVLLFDAAAKQGEKNSQYFLAMAIVEGHGGILPSWEAAIPWFEKSAEQDVVKAQFQLGNAYATGHGVERDLERAAYWYRRGLKIAEGDRALIERLRIMIRSGVKVQPDDPAELIEQAKAEK